MLYREWGVLPISEETVGNLCAQGKLPHLLAKILAARGMETPQQVKDLLLDNSLPSPFAMKDMDKAVLRISQAIENEEVIAVFGDYDVDGVTATTLLYTYLEQAGAQVFYKLPSRNDDDYGLSPTLVDAMADKGIDLIVTVDNGTTAFEAAERAKERGLSLVVTDHHLPYDTLPKVDALVNPCREDDESGLSGLSGAGVAFMLLAGLEGCSPEELLAEFGELAAIGTVADVMKLVGPNRLIVRAGLLALSHTQRPGLRALISACGWQDKDISVENISYGLAPRLNAAGRMDDATTALKLMLCDDEEDAQILVESLQQQNAARQKAEQEILELIEQQMEGDFELKHARVLVIWGEGWHQGIIGIVASRLVDKYAKPAIVISFDGDEGKGSGRSFAGFSLHGAIASCEDILIRYGGHDLAAGFSINKEYAKQFRKRVNKWAASKSPMPALPKLVADVQSPLSQLTVEEVQGLDALAPCGSGNPQPCIFVHSAEIESLYPVSEGKHCRLRLTQAGTSVYAVLFGTGPEKLAYKAGDFVDVLLAVSVYSAGKAPQVSARIMEMRPAGMDNRHVAQTALFESFLAGMEADKEQSLQLAPTREDTAAVYRQIRDGLKVCFTDLRPTFARLEGVQAARVLTSLAALEELGLIGRDDDTACYCILPTQGKMDLASSNLLARLAI